MLNNNLWTWGHKVNGHYGYWGIDIESKTTPAQAAELFHSANILMVMPPSEEEAADVAGYDKVIWQITAEDGFDFSRDINAVKSLARQYPNIKGVIIDDLTSQEIGKGMTPEDLAKVRELVKSGDIPLEFWGVLYSMNFTIPRIEEYMRLLDVITLWTWEARDLVNMEADFKKAKEIVGDIPIIRGVYVYDFGESRQMPMDMMEYQCSVVEKWMKEEVIAGAIMLSSCCADLPYQAVEYAQKWTAEIPAE